MNTQALTDLTQSLGWIINQEKSELKPTQVFSFLGYKYHLDSALVKPTQERWLKLQNMILRLKTCKMFYVTNWVARLNGEDGPGGTSSHEVLSVSSQGALDISSVDGQPPSLDRKHFCTPRLVAESHKHDERCRSSPQRPQHPTLYRRLKTAFLLALAYGKRRSEIYAWFANKVSNLGQWEKVALFPSSDFIAKNQLAREGSQSVSPLTIPALTTIVDRQFKEDRTLCPVRAVRYYLDRTKHLRGSRSLLFISFKKEHTSDIRPATLSSWLKQTILLCYKQADQQALDLVQVKAHDIRASKAFYGGVLVDQIMQACHWKAHSTFSNFYLKDLTW